MNPDTYSVSIPLGSTINMAGAAVTINVLTLAAVTTLGIQVDFATALILLSLIHIWYILSAASAVLIFFILYRLIFGRKVEK